MSVATKTLMNNWYGYDKKIERPEGISGFDLAIQNSYSDYYINPIPARKISYLRTRDDKIRATSAYIPPCDGYTDDDFIAWLDGADLATDEGYRVGPLRKQVSENQWPVQSMFSEFFRSGSPRSDRIFRIIELHEFLLRGDNKQTFENFLLTDTEYVEACKNLRVTETDALRMLMDYKLPAFLRFDRKTNLKTKRLLLPLTKVEIEKLYDFQDNPLIEMNKQNNHSYDFAVEFIKASSGDHSKLEIKEMTMRALIDDIMLIAMEGQASYWKSRKRGVKKTMQILMDYLGGLTKNTTLTRNLAYVISVDGLRNLDPSEIIAVISGFESPARWAIPTPTGAAETICELINDKKVDAQHMCKIIAHVILNESAPLELKEDFDWDAISDVPPEWAANLLSGHRKANMKRLVAVTEMMS